MAASFDYCLFGAHVRFGAGCAFDLPGEIRALGCRRPAILMQQRMADTRGWSLLRDRLREFETLVFSAIPAHGSVELIESIAAQASAFGCDSIVAIGGGSVSDSAKALAMLLSEGGRLADHATRFTPPSTLEIPLRTRPKPPIIALPATASGAELTPSFGIREDGHKLLFWNRNLSSTTVLIDPALSRDVPLGLLRETGMNGLAHCLEGLYSRNRSIVADGIALQSLRLFAEGFADGSLDEDGQRERIVLAGHLSGMVLSMARSCLHHAICHVIGARHGVRHGAANTVILPFALRFNEQAAGALLAPALAVLNQVSGTRHESVADWVKAAALRLGLPASLSELGITEADLPAIAEQTMGERGLALNPRAVNGSQDVLSILRQAL